MTNDPWNNLSLQPQSPPPEPPSSSLLDPFIYPRRDSGTRLRALLYQGVIWALAWMLVVQVYGESVDWLLPLALLAAVVAFPLTAFQYFRRYKDLIAGLRMAMQRTLPFLLWAGAVQLAYATGQIDVSAFGVFGIGVVTAIRLSLPIWNMEMVAGGVYLHRRRLDLADRYHFPARPVPLVDEDLIETLVVAGLPRASLKIFLERSAPDYLRDNLKTLLLDIAYKQLAAVIQANPEILDAASFFRFNPDPDDNTLTERKLREAFTVRLEKLAPAQSGPAAALTGALEKLYNDYRRANNTLYTLFEQCDDWRRIAAPVVWISTFDEWRLIWDKNRMVNVSLNLDALDTLDKVPYGLRVKFLCSFEPDRIRVPRLRQLIAQQASVAATERFVQSMLTNAITPEAQQLFESMKRPDALERGTRVFRERLPRMAQQLQNDMRLRIEPWSIQVQPVVDGRVMDARRDIEIEIGRLQALMEAGHVDDAYRAELVMRMLMLQNIPRSTLTFPRNVIDFPSQNIQPTPPPSNPPRIDPRPPRRRSIDELADSDVIDVHPDQDDPDSYGP